MFENSFARWGEKPAITFLRYGDVVMWKRH
jgi:hypothetical protein